MAKFIQIAASPAGIVALDEYGIGFYLPIRGTGEPERTGWRRLPPHPESAAAAATRNETGSVPANLE